MPKKLIIYGATGYTGRMASRHAKDLALDVILAGRTHDTLKTLAEELKLPFKVFDVTFPDQLSTALRDVDVLLNCAGPFHRTAQPLMQQCLRDRVHYLDIAAELDSYRIALDRDEEAKTANIMLLPGCGGSVAMLGCLAGHIVNKIRDPLRIDIALHISGSISRGSAVSAKENVTSETLHCVDGHLVAQQSGQHQAFDFGDGKGAVSCAAVTLPDLLTLWRSTGAPNINTFVYNAGNVFSFNYSDSMEAGPTAEEREATPYHASVIVTARDGKVRRAALHTVNGYTFTSLASVEAAQRVLGGEYKAGFQTPVQVFGSGFVQCVKGCRIGDM